MEYDWETAINMPNSTGICVAASQFLPLDMQVSNLELSCENQQDIYDELRCRW